MAGQVAQSGRRGAEVSDGHAADVMQLRNGPVLEAMALEQKQQGYDTTGVEQLEGPSPARELCLQPPVAQPSPGDPEATRRSLPDLLERASLVGRDEDAADWSAVAEHAVRRLQIGLPLRQHR